MAREDKGSATSSYQDAPSGKSGDLAARRARLRGTLSKQIPSPDNYTDQTNGDSADNQDSEPTNGASSEPRAPIPSATYNQAPVPVLPIETVSKDRPTKDKGGEPEKAPYGSNPIAGYSSQSISGSNPIATTSSPIGASSPSSSSAKQLSADLFSVDSPRDKDELPESNDSSSAAAPVPAAAPAPAPVVEGMSKEELNELIGNLDTQISICSMNLAQIAKVAGEQMDLVRNLTDVVQNQAFGEIGLSLSSLSESMSAALEPMKAVGELVPAIDNLVTTIEKGAANKEEAKLTPDQLVMSLANQLSSNMIDPWTFKCAYMAVFPSEHPADLLKKLVDLLGTQSISGDLFRAAYDAVQAPDPPRPVYAPPPQAAPGEEVVREVVREVVTVVQDEAVLAQIEELRQFNEELRGRMDTREAEYAEILAAKDSEVQESQAMLNSRFEEFNARHEEVSEMMRQRNEQINQKDAELQQKDSELQILRNQLDEMKEHTREMVADLQKQLVATQQAVEEAAKAKAAAPLTKAQTNFFEATGSSPSAPASGSLFSEPAPQPAFNAAPTAAFAQPAPPLNVPAPQPAAPEPAPAPAPAPAPSPSTTATQAELQPISEPVGLAANLANPSVSTQAIPRPQVSAPTTPMMGTGSYGSGVRAQVFEVIVRQALAGAPWREICAGPMQVNNISPDEVEAEVKRRQALLKK